MHRWNETKQTDGALSAGLLRVFDVHRGESFLRGVARCLRLCCTFFLNVWSKGERMFSFRLRLRLISFVGDFEWTSVLSDETGTRRVSNRAARNHKADVVRSSLTYLRKWKWRALLGSRRTYTVHQLVISNLFSKGQTSIVDNETGSFPRTLSLMLSHKGYYSWLGFLLMRNSYKSVISNFTIDSKRQVKVTDLFIHFALQYCRKHSNG